MLKNEISRFEGIRKEKVFVGPQIVTIKITDQCNYNCLFCWIHSRLLKGKRKSTHLPLQGIEKIILDCYRLGCDEIQISGNGEPFTHPEIYEIIELVKSKGMRVSISTNGSFDLKRIRTIAKIDSFIINHSSFTKKTFNLIHNPAKETFEEKNKKIKTLLHFKQLIGRPKIKIIFMITSLNYREIPNMYDFCKNYRVDTLELRPIFARPKMESLVPNQKDWSDIRSILQKLIRQNDPYLKKTNIISLFNVFKNVDTTDLKIIDRSMHDEERLLYYERKFKKDFCCYLGWYCCNITLNGDVSPCCHQESLYAGNIHVQSLKKIWESKRYNEIRKKMKHNFDITELFWQRCHNCHMLEFNKEIAEKYLSHCKALQEGKL